MTILCKQPQRNLKMLTYKEIIQNYRERLQNEILLTRDNLKFLRERVEDIELGLEITIQELDSVEKYIETKKDIFNETI